MIWRVGFMAIIIQLDKPACKYYSVIVKMTKEIREAARKLASAGGRARAKKYDKTTLRKWGKKGGRPKSDVAELALREGISRQAAWYRLRKSKGGKPRKDGGK